MLDNHYLRIGIASLVILAGLQVLTLSRLTTAPADVRRDVKEMRAVLSSEIIEVEQRLSAVEIAQAETKGATRFRFTSLDFGSWHEEFIRANKGKDIVIPPFTTAVRE